MDWANRSADGLDDAFYSPPTSSQVSLDSATHNSNADVINASIMEQDQAHVEMMHVNSKSSASEKRVHGLKTSSKSINSSSTASTTSGQRETVRDGSPTIFSRIKQSLVLPLGLFAQQHQQGCNDGQDEEHSDGSPVYHGGSGGGTSDPTINPLSGLQAALTTDLAPQSSLARADILPRDDSMCSAYGRLNNFPPSFPEFTNPFGDPFECNHSPVSLDSNVPSPLFSDIGAQSTPPWTPVTPHEVHTRGQSSIIDRKRQSSVGSIQIKDVRHHTVEGGKGKQAAPPLPYDTLIADITNDAPPTVNEPMNIEDNEEWWGLQYTLELSRRDSRASDTSSNHTGEHSKSRESWAAIHQGTVSPIFEDVEFQTWKKWHDQLDRLEHRRRRKRTIAFKEESKRLANLFVDEMYAIRAIELYEHALADSEIANAVEWAEYASARRSDPYHPPEQHRLAWVLKNHRSFTCLRELKLIPKP